MSKTVKVVRIPGAVTELMLDDNATVRDALGAAGIAVASGEAVKVNGSTVDPDSTVPAGASVVVAKSAKGN